MKSWENNSLLDQITIENTKDKTYPIACPICKKKECHLFIYLYNESNRRGGLWIWCSNCKKFEHFQYIVPLFWKNCEKIDHTKLCASPDYLEENKAIIDNHINSVLYDVFGNRGGSD